MSKLAVLKFIPVIPSDQVMENGPKFIGSFPVLPVMVYDYFLIFFLVFFALQMIWPRMYLGNQRWTRDRFRSWGVSIVLTLGNSLMIILATSVFYWLARNNGLTPLNLYSKLELSWVSRFLLTLLVIDFGAFFVHFIFHKIRGLWIVHRVHHIEKYVDVLTSHRLHPIEGLFFGAGLYWGVFISGCNVLELILALNVLKAFSIYLHSDWRMPYSLEKYFGIIFMTSGHHHIHHDRQEDLHNSNFGLMLTVWDRIFKTHRPPEKEGRYDYGLPGLEAQNNGMLRLLSMRLK